MPDVFERFFGAFDRTPSDYYELERLDPHYRIFFKDDQGARPSTYAPGLYPSSESSETGDTIDITPDREQAKQVFEAYEPDAGVRLSNVTGWGLSATVAVLVLDWGMDGTALDRPIRRCIPGAVHRFGPLTLSGAPRHRDYHGDHCTDSRYAHTRGTRKYFADT